MKHVKKQVEHSEIKVSIIIAARNIETTIEETLTSVLKQEFAQWEALIIVNASSDKTLAISKQFAAKDPRVKVIEQSIPGVSAARNKGIEQAQHEWLLFLDGDDWIPANHLQLMTTALSANPTAAGVYCGWCWVSPDGFHFHQYIGRETGDLFHVHADECPNAIHAYVIKREIIDAVGGFDPELHTCEDWDIWQRVSRHGMMFVRVPEMLAPCRMRPFSASTDGRRILADGLQVLEKGHTTDARVPGLHPKYPNGLPSHDLAEKKIYLLCSAAGLLIGRGENPIYLLDELTEEITRELDFYAVADCIVLATQLSACKPLVEWAEAWPQFAPLAHELVDALEEHTGTTNLARDAKAIMPRLAQIHMGAIGGANQLRTLKNKLILFPYSLKAGIHRHMQLQKYHLRRFIVTIFRLMPRLNQWALKLYQRISPAEDEEFFQELFDDQADPWGYTSAYEQTKYEQTLAMLPDTPIENAIELGCAEGHFSIQLAPLVQQLLCTDISQTALDRSAQRGNELANIKYQRLDITNDPIPGKFDLMICSEVLYYAGSRKHLSVIAQKMADALNPQGCLIMAHGNLVVDEPDQTGFNWSHAYGAKGIGEVFSNISSLQFEHELHTPLYRVQLFRKVDETNKTVPPAEPKVVEMEQPTALEPDVESQVLWNGTSDILPILLYHSVAPNGSEALADWRVTPEKFSEHLSALQKAGYQTITIDDCYNWLYESTPLPKNAVLITFDDGYQDFMDHAWPCLAKHGFTATIFLVANAIGKTNAWDSQYGEVKPLMDWKQILQLRNEGISFGSHTATHPMLTEKNWKTIVSELELSKEILEQEFGEPVRTIAYPYGDNNILTRFLTGFTGYDLAFTCDSQISHKHHSPLALPRIEVTESDTGESIIETLSL